MSHNCLVLDEAAHIENFDEFYTSVMPTISAGRETKIIMISTPKGLNHFHKFWVESEQGENDFVRHFVPWQKVPGRDEKWKETTLRQIGNDIQRFAQEYDADFIGSSSTLVAGWKLKELVHRIPIAQRDGLRLYENPIMDKNSERCHSYVILVDTSRGKGLDYSSFQVLDVTEMPYRQVATYRSNLVTPADYAGVVARVGRSYNSAAALVEINDLGGQVADCLHFDHEYPTILYTTNAGHKGKVITPRWGKNVDRGITTSRTVKAVGCSLLKLLIEQNQMILNDRDTIEELSHFTRKNNSYEAEPGYHDDTVMPLVLFGWLTDQQFFKELTNINTIQRLRDRTEEEIDEEMLTFGFQDDGIDDMNVGDQEVIPAVSSGDDSWLLGDGSASREPWN